MIFGLGRNVDVCRRNAIPPPSYTKVSNWVQVPNSAMFMLHNFLSESTYFYNVHKCLNFAFHFFFCFRFCCTSSSFRITTSYPILANSGRIVFVWFFYEYMSAALSHFSIFRCSGNIFGYSLTWDGNRISFETDSESSERPEGGAGGRRIRMD